MEASLRAAKQTFFPQAAGEPLRLRYVKAPYGPDAGNLRPVLREIEGLSISGYAAGGDTRDKQHDKDTHGTSDRDCF